MQAASRGGARFLDDHDRDRGWAAVVTRRVQAVSGLTVLDVTAPEPALATFLTTLDKMQLSVHHTGESADSYTFSWASGYQNGTQIRIQGVVDRRL
jgi:hypothetical protein